MLTLDLPAHVDEARARLLFAVALFEDGQLGIGRAADIGGVSYRAFLGALRERGIPPVPADDDPDTFEAEMRSVREQSAARRPAA